MKTAYSYIRFSHPKQAEGDSERRQREAAVRWCERNGYKLDDKLNLHDFGVSAYRGKHRTKGALSAFLAGVKSGRIAVGSVLLVESLDRLSREEIDEAMIQFLAIIRSGIVVVTLVPVEMTYDRKTIAANASAMMMALMVMGRAHEESETKSQRVADAWVEKRRNASEKKLTAKCPGWLRLDADGTFHEIGERVAIVKRIVRMAISGLGPVAIAANLNREKVPTLTVRRKNPAQSWEFSTIKYLLTSRTLLGEYQPKRQIFDSVDGVKVRRLVAAGDAIPGYYSAAIDEPDFWRVQAGLDARRRGTRGRTGRNVANLFGRTLVSGVDGSTMRLAQKHGDRINLVSASAVRGLAKYESFPYGVFEREFWQWVKELTIEDAPPVNRITEIEGRLATCRAKLTRVQTAVRDASGTDGLDGLLTLVRDLGAEEKRLANELATERGNAAKQSSKETLQQVASIMQRLASLKGNDDELRATREQLRATIGRLCRLIRLWAWGSTVERNCACIVEFADGRRRLFAIHTKRGGMMTISAGPREPLTVRQLTRLDVGQLMRRACDLIARVNGGRRPSCPFDNPRLAGRSIKVFPPLSLVHEQTAT